MNNLDLPAGIGENIRILRKQKGLKQNELAQELDISPNYISQIESGKKYPSLRIIERISKVLNVNIAHLLNNDSLLDDIIELTKKHDIKRVLFGIEKLYNNELSTNLFRAPKNN
ncbi:helix-turn-helix transcriptional regulator [Candidatus Roizmanbacteria bacterium]|nr:helix-turn-helix transcriptional regulator [Candidatus Roizmanbacteria bacterium]